MKPLGTHGKAFPAKMSAVNGPLAEKYDSLLGVLVQMRSIVVAYSGGVDSTFLAAVGHDALGINCLAVTALSPSMARREFKDARDLANARGWNHRVVRTHEFQRDEYARNDRNRCYWCKVELFDVLVPIASERHAQVAVGTNLDDLDDYRPGHTAAIENGVRAPMVEVGLTKRDIRSLSRSLGLATADKPAAPCLSSRVAYGIPVTPRRLRRIEAAEDFLLSLGFSDVRVRDHGDAARVEVPPEEVKRAEGLSDEIAASLSAFGFEQATVDPRGLRSGSLNDVLMPVIRAHEQPTAHT
jgi:pyridinium-3,5-biscarboxylic acid mononucleotide sulfurtransferase